MKLKKTPLSAILKKHMRLESSLAVTNQFDYAMDCFSAEISSIKEEMERPEAFTAS